MTLLDMENRESILSALNNLEIEVNGAPSPILEEYLREIAKHGLTFIPWFHVKPLILQKFNHVMDEFAEDIDENKRRNMPRTAELNDLRERVYKELNQFEGTPFTIQRICELLTEPRKHYTRPDKFLRGFEKVCLVVSTVDCYGNKIYNIDPRLSGSIERSSTIMNGTSTECGSNSSVEDSSSGTKRSDEEEEDVDEDNTATTESVTPPRSPCINFYRSLTDRRPPSNLAEGHQKPAKDILIGSYSPGIPGKHTLQRPFLSNRTSSSFRPILEESEDLACGTDEVQDRGEKRVDDVVMEDADVGEEIRIGVASDGQPLPSTRSFAGIQKLFLENDAEETAKPTTPTVPPIDQMLRPMGQLEAFVNTISMVPSTPPPADVATSVTVANTTVSTASTPDESVDCCATKNGKEDLKEVQIPESTTEMANTEVEAGCEEERTVPPKLVEEVDGTTRLTVSRPSLKRESFTFDESDEEASSEESPELMASPAKRMRADDGEEESVDRGESANVNVESPPMEQQHNEEMEETPIKEGLDDALHPLQNIDESASKQKTVEEEAEETQKQVSGESGAIIDSETGEHEST
ncbi:Serine/threonine-protein phosphatase 4 regulatory subunit 2-A [Echinococcus granulosus]|uniref:Serine/threonine-protein phosphatase 4 regulatory subunit 2-A n=1 Tax=Echinococcus granulosus TaxID=6210 RepID=U6JGQ0_ECHGR|nr:Serine/threonine-protein phosphatase 4 regulatory subunit 2-A [Echinococcus granulosus]EUB55443.1 Serine/threonine-protein phosphatase 4 regulatory subunit 2-A [Echinococcus granulosus]KAH9285096.1 Serine/threonine-protein phosphatase 4 regulatory subunit 2-A [Echinococcus granulosus]CDS23283.1 serine:threonine protein phosphatase 4 [Echinococcus granulosus]